MSMIKIKLQSEFEAQQGFYYEVDLSGTPFANGKKGNLYIGQRVDEHSGKSSPVAVKVINSDLPYGVIDSVRREASIRFLHENLVEMLGFFETTLQSEDGKLQKYYFVVSELLVGVSLEQFFARNFTDQFGNTVEYAQKMYGQFWNDVNTFAINLVKQVLSGVMKMHEAGFVHRCIDPSNIVLTQDGRVKIIDFWNVRNMNEPVGFNSILADNTLPCLPEYAAPEIIRKSIEEQGPCTDIYAIGTLLYRTIVGHAPFVGNTDEILRDQMQAQVPLKLITDNDIKDVIRIATEKQIQKRFASAAEFKMALEQIGQPESHETSVVYTRKKSKSKMFVIIAIAVLAVAGGLVFFLMNNKGSKGGAVVEGVDLETVDNASSDSGAEAGNTSESKAVSYAAVVEKLKNSATAAEGYRELQVLVKKGNADATYLMSRLIFKSALKDDYCPDSIRKMQSLLNVPADNLKAHQMLKDVIKIDPDNYHARFELAMDYWKSEQRTEAIPTRDGERAYYYFRSARKMAIEHQDDFYLKMIEHYLSDYDLWQKKLKKLNR